MDYPQMKYELSTKDLGYYYLGKWLKFYLNTSNISLKVYPDNQVITHQPQSLLAAIYLQFYYELCENELFVRCPICGKYRIINEEKKKEDDGLAKCSEEGLEFYYHDRCIRRIRKRLKEHELYKKEINKNGKEKNIGVPKTIELAREAGYLEKKSKAKNRSLVD
jgi:hypothetical protein